MKDLFMELAVTKIQTALMCNSKLTAKKIFDIIQIIRESVENKEKNVEAEFIHDFFKEAEK